MHPILFHIPILGLPIYDTLLVMYLRYTDLIAKLGLRK